MKSVSAHILNLNCKDFVIDCIESVSHQLYKKLEITITDNDSSDGSFDILEKLAPSVRLIRNSLNKGYSKAHNDFIKRSEGEFLLFLNADIVLEPNFVDEAIETIEQGRDIGMAQGKLYRMQPKAHSQKILDTTGVVLHKNRRNSDRDFGATDTGGHRKDDFLFGATGAALLCRREMLEEIKIGDEYFDEDFFAYREEVDLAWRAQAAGWRCAYAPNAIAYHYRLYSPDRRKEIPRDLRTLQYRNRYLMLVKNELPATLILHFPYILLFEITAVFHVLFREPFLLTAWPQIIRLLPKILRKRRQIMKKRRVSFKYILGLIK